MRKFINVNTSKEKRICEKGHSYYKNSDCKTCPICEKEKYKSHPFSFLSTPAIRALDSKGFSDFGDLENVEIKTLIKLHGFGKSALQILEKELKKRKK